MMKLIALAAFGSLGLTAIAAGAAAQGQTAQPVTPPPPMTADLKVGDMAPDFSLQGSDGKVHKLSAYRGKTVVLAWFPAAFTGG